MGEPTPDRRRRALILLLILAAGLLVRGIHFGAIHDSAFILFPLAADQTDMWGFWTWSGQILAGDLWGRDPWHPMYAWMSTWGTPEEWSLWWGGRMAFQQEPFYPYFIATLRTAGLGLSGIVWLQLVLTVVAVVPMYLLARRCTSETGAFVAAALVALYAPLMFYSGALLRDWTAALVDPTLVLLCLYANSRPRARARVWAVVGAAMGVALIIKYTTLLLVLGLIGWSLVVARANRPAMAWRGAALLVGLLMGLSPLMARNAVVGAPLLQISNRPVESFVMANVADVMPVGMNFSAADAPAVLRKAEGRMGPALVETLKTYDGDVLFFLYHQWVRFRALADPFEVPNNLSLSYGEGLSPILRWLPGWGTLVPLGLSGLLLAAFTAPRRHSALLIYFIAVSAAAMVQFVFDRYRIALALPLCVGAGLLVAEIQRRLWQRRWAECGAIVAVVIALFALQHFVLPLPWPRHHFQYAVHPTSYGVAVGIYRRQGRYADALAEIERVRALAPRHPALAAEIASFADSLEGPVALEMAWQALQDGHRPQALELFARTERTIGSGDLLVWAELYETVGAPDLARQRAEQYLAQNPAGDRAAEARVLLARLPRARD